MTIRCLTIVAVNANVNRHVYADQLVNAPITSARTLELTGDDNALDQQAGIVYLPVLHEGNTQSSDKEPCLSVCKIKRSFCRINELAIVRK